MRPAGGIFLSLATIGLLAGTVAADPSGHCYAGSDGHACLRDAPADATGTLKAGIHAFYDDASTTYAHGALGAGAEWTRLTFLVQGTAEHGPYHLAHLRLPRGRVFEDTAPRLLHLPGADPALLVVESDRALGSRLALYRDDASDRLRLLAATAFIGRRHRWLAPLGAADLDGDGRVEIAYVETPHIAPTLKVVRLDGDQLALVARAPGLTNHRFGDPFIQGRIAACDGRPTILTADAGWTQIIATLFTDGMLTSRAVAIYAGPHSFDTVPGCD